MKPVLHYETIEGGVNAHMMAKDADRPYALRERRGCVICFTEQGRIVGTLEWYLEDGIHNAAGTFVDGDFQGRGIATDLWALALADSQTKDVNVNVVSDRGMTLVRSLEKKFPKICFVIFDEGNRKLRVIKKRRGKKGKDRSSLRSAFHPGGY